MDYSKEILDKIVSFMKEREISYSFDEETGYITTDFVLNNGKTELDFAVAVLDFGAVSYALLPVNIPVEEYNRTAEYLHRANYGLLHGNFEFDYKEGRVQYKTFVMAMHGNITDEQTESLFVTPMTVIENYMPGLIKVLKAPKSSLPEIMEEVK